MTVDQLVLSIGGGDDVRCWIERPVFWRWLLVVQCLTHGTGWLGRWEIADERTRARDAVIYGARR